MGDKSIWHFLAAASCLIVAGCANIGAPSGGPKDETPPKLLRAIPANGTTNFESPFITLVFDEFIQLKNPNEQVLVSPNPSQNLKYRVKRKTLHITLPDSLPENTTFTIGFGDALVDLAEGNPASNLQYVFSTGDFLDSLTLTGKLVDFRTHSPQEGFIVALYEKATDSAVFNDRPFYLRKTNASGEFDFDHLKPGAFKVVAFKDENGNLHYDPGSESIGFLDTLVKLPVLRPLTIKSSKPYPNKLNLTNVWRSQQAQIWGSLNKPKSSDQQLRISVPHDSIKWNRTKDTFSCWLDTLDNNNVEIQLIEASDTIGKRTLFGLQQTTIETFYKNPLSLQALKTSPLGPPGQIKLKTSVPIALLKNQNLAILKDSMLLADTTYNITYSYHYINLFFYSSIIGSANIILRQGFATDIYNRTTVPDTIPVTVSKEGDFGSLKIKVDSLKNKPTILQITNQKGQPIFQSPRISRDTVLVFSKILPGNYYVQGFQDLDQSGFWTPANYPDQFPEPFYINPEPLTIRSNWELNVDFSPKW